MLRRTFDERQCRNPPKVIHARLRATRRRTTERIPVPFPARTMKGTFMAKILCVLYDDPADGYPTSYPRDDLPRIDRYPDGQTLPSPKAIDFQPGQLLGSVSGELGLRTFLESAGHEFVVTSDKEGPYTVTNASSASCSSA